MSLMTEFSSSAMRASSETARADWFMASAVSLALVLAWSRLSVSFSVSELKLIKAEAAKVTQTGGMQYYVTGVTDPTGRRYANPCIGCDAVHERHLGPVLARLREQRRREGPA